MFRIAGGFVTPRKATASLCNVQDFSKPQSGRKAGATPGRHLRTWRALLKHNLKPYSRLRFIYFNPLHAAQERWIALQIF